MRAALARRSGQERTEVRSGVCRCDLSAMAGVLPNKKSFVLGHEAVGELVEVGARVPELAVDHHVIVCWVPPCGRCADCLNGQGNLCELFGGTAPAANLAVDGEI